MSALDTAADAVINLFTPQKRERPMPVNARRAQVNQEFAALEQEIGPIVRQVTQTTPQQRAERAMDAIEGEGAITIEDLKALIAQDKAEHDRMVEEVALIEGELNRRTAPLYEEMKALMASRQIVRETIAHHTNMLKAPFNGLK